MQDASKMLDVPTSGLPHGGRNSLEIHLLVKVRVNYTQERRIFESHLSILQNFSELSRIQLKEG